VTTIVGIQGKDFIVMAADSQITEDNQRIISPKTPKIIRIGKYILGISGDARPGDILTYNWNPPVYKQGDEIQFMGKSIIPSMLEAFKINGFDLEGEDKKEISFQYLLGFNGKLFSIGDDMSFLCTESGYYAAGSGGSFALGYLHSVDTKKIKSVQAATLIVKKALAISCRLDINTCPPIQIVTQSK